MELLKLTSIIKIFCLSLLIFCVLSNAAFPNSSFHKLTNSSWQRRNVEGKDYEVVQLRILSKRSADDKEVIRVHLSAFGKNIHLRLQRNEDFSDELKSLRVYEATLTDDGGELKEIILEDDDSGVPYIDPIQMAAVTIRHGPDGVLQMDGVIGDDLLIRPASTDINFLTELFDYDEDFTFENDNRIVTFEKDGSNFSGNFSSAAVKSGIHLVYRSLMKSKVSRKVAVDDVHNIELADDGGHRQGPLHAWPEVLLMVDSNTYAMHIYHGDNETQMRRYYISFLNGVDLRFKTLSNPKISLILSQIVIFKSMAATPFLKENLKPNTNVLDGDRALSALARHLYLAKERNFYPEFDIAVLLTNLDMCTTDFVRCNRNTVGTAYLMGACKAIHSKERWMGVAIVEDHGGFDGVLIAAHEIGHLLGVDHDGTPHLHLGLQHTAVCSQKDGYIMSYKLDSGRIFQWSRCSIKQFRHFLSSKRASCLFNQPSHSNELEGSLLPGVVLSLDEQCKRIWGTRACAWDSRVCFSLHCYTDVDYESCLDGLAPAAEGSPCGEDLHCRHGKCISKYLIYSQASSMAPAKDRFKHTNSLKISPTKKSYSEEVCTEDSDEFFCSSYFWTIGRKEACRNSRIIEECCYAKKVLCKVRSISKSL